jgi:PmbA protein
MTKHSDSLFARAEKALGELRKRGAEWGDVSAFSFDERSVSIENGSIKAAETARTAGVIIRAFVDGGRGFYTTNGVSDEEIVRGARLAYEMALSAEKDPDFVSLPSPEEAEEIEGLYDERLEAYGIQDCVAVAVKNVEEARKVCRDVVVMGGVGAGSYESVFSSLSGIEISKKRTSVEAGVSAIIRREDDIGSFHDFDAGHSLGDVELEKLGETVTKEALEFLGAKKIGTGRMAIVLGPLAAYSFLHFIVSAANAESYQRRRSFLTDKLGEKIASEELSLTDDGLIPKGIYSGSFDGEGARRKAVAIVEKGVLAALLHNSYTANKAKVPNTGHGSQSGGISPTNCRVALGERSAGEIIRGTDEGLYVNVGNISADGVSGDVSSSVDFAFKIEKGEIAYPVASAMIGGHVLELLQNIEEVSSDYREEPGNILPTVKISDVQVIGS